MQHKGRLKNGEDSRMAEHTASEQREDKEKELSPRDLWDNFGCTNIRILRVPEGEGERERT